MVLINAFLKKKYIFKKIHDFCLQRAHENICEISNEFSEKSRLFFMLASKEQFLRIFFQELGSVKIVNFFLNFQWP